MYFLHVRVEISRYTGWCHVHHHPGYTCLFISLAAFVLDLYEADKWIEQLLNSFFLNSLRENRQFRSGGLVGHMMKFISSSFFF